MEEVEVRSDIQEEIGDLQVAGIVKKKEEEETALDGEFIKVEKEPLDHGADQTSVEDDKIHSLPPDGVLPTVTTTGDLAHAQERIRELECVVERVSGELEASKSENYRLENEVLHTKNTIEESLKKYEGMEIIHSRLKGEIIEAGERNASQLNTLQQKLHTHEADLKEFIGIKEAFDSTNIELEKAKNRVHELEQDLSNSVREARKFEEMHGKSVSVSESQIKRTLELEGLLGEAITGSKALDDRIFSLQNELHEKISEILKAEEEFSKTSVALVAVQEELRLSKNSAHEFEQQLAANQTIVSELNKELSIREASESELKSSLTLMKEDMLDKFSELEETRFRLQEETGARVFAEERLELKETQFSLVRVEFDKVVKEKEEVTVLASDLENTVLQVKGMFSDLESKLILAEGKLSEKELLLSQTLSKNEEEKEAFESEVAALRNSVLQTKELCSGLEAKLKLAEDTLSEKEAVFSEKISNLRKEKEVLEVEVVDLTCNISQKSDVIYGLREELKLSEEKYSETVAQSLSEKTELGEKLVSFEESEKAAADKNSELEQNLRDLNMAIAETKSQLQDAEARFAEAQQENKKLREEDVVNKEKERQLLELSERISRELGSAEEAREKLNAQVSELEAYSTTLSSRNLELMVELEDSGKILGETRLLVDVEKDTVLKLQEQLETQELKFREAEADSDKLRDRVSELTDNVEALKEKTACLDQALETSFISEKGLKEKLDVAKSEKIMLEEALNLSDGKLTELERLLESSQTELVTVREKLAGVEEDLRVTGVREDEAEERLKLEIERSEQREQILNDRLKELEGQAEALVTRNSEAEAALVKELGEMSLKVGFLEKRNEEIENQVLETERKASQFASENELLAETNTQLKRRIHELQEVLDSTLSEKAGALEELDSHTNTISELTEQNKRSSELLSVTESHVREAETQLEALKERFNQRDAEARELGEKLSVLRSQLQVHEEHAQEDNQKVETWRLELETTTIRLKDLEHFVKEVQSAAEESEKLRTLLSDSNLKLTQEVSDWENKFKDIETNLAAVVSDKTLAGERLRVSENEVEILAKRFAFETEKLQSQVSSLLEENNSIKKEYADSKNEVQAVKYQLDEKIIGQKAIEDIFKTRIETLEEENADKSSEIARMKELEAELVLEKDRMKHEVEDITAVITSREAELRSKIEDHARTERDREAQFELVGQLRAELDRAHISQKEEEKKKKEVNVLEERVKELEHKLESTRSKKKGDEGNGTPEVKNINAEEGGGGASMNFKFVLGVAFVSAVIGVILGKY